MSSTRLCSSTSRVGSRGDDLAVSQDGHLVGDREHLVEEVGAEDDRDAAGGELAHDREELGALVGRQGCRRLVEDHQLRCVPAGDGAHDREQLLLGGGQAGHDRVRVDLAADPLLQLEVTRPQPGVVATPARFGEEHVLERGEGGRERRVLVGGAHPGRGSLVRAAPHHRGTAERDDPASRCHHSGQDLHHRGLAGAVAAHQSVDAAAPHGHVDRAQGLHRPVDLGDARQAQQRRRGLHHGYPEVTPVTSLGTALNVVRVIVLCRHSPTPSCWASVPSVVQDHDRRRALLRY